MREVEVFNETNEKLEEIDELSKLFPFLLDYFNLDNVVCSVIIVDNKKIHEINKEYRNIDITQKSKISIFDIFIIF